MFETTALIKYDNLEEAVRKYCETIRLAEESLKAATAAQELMRSYCSQYDSPFSRMPEGDCHLTILRAYWRAAFIKSGVYELCSTKMRERFDEEMKKNTLPEFTMENIRRFFEDLDTGSIIKDRLKTTWEFLRPRNWKGLKTNERNQGAIGTKLILYNIFERNWDGKTLRLRYYSEAPLRDCENTFRLFDGRDFALYPDGIVTVLAEALRNGQSEAENEYFHIKGHFNGNAHVILKRADIVLRLNQMIGKFFLGAGE